MTKQHQSNVASSPIESMSATGTVRGVFFSLGTTPSCDPQLDCAKAIVDLFAAVKNTADAAIFTLTESGILDAMIALKDQTSSKPVIAE